VFVYLVFFNQTPSSTCNKRVFRRQEQFLRGKAASPLSFYPLSETPPTCHSPQQHPQGPHGSGLLRSALAAYVVHGVENAPGAAAFLLYIAKRRILGWKGRSKVTLETADARPCLVGSRASIPVHQRVVTALALNPFPIWFFVLPLYRSENPTRPSPVSTRLCPRPGGYW